MKDYPNKTDRRIEKIKNLKIEEFNSIFKKTEKNLTDSHGKIY